MRILPGLALLVSTLPAAAQTTVASNAVPLARPVASSPPSVGATASLARPWPDLDGVSAAERRAQTLWNLRAAMNVAALQCQFSPFLRTVTRWNWINQQHGREFLGAQAVLQGYFKRRGGTIRAGTALMDQWNTRLWQSFAGADRQLGFCEATATAEQEVLVQPVGKLALVAEPELAAVRAGMSAVPPAPVLSTVAIAEPEPLAPVSEGRKRRR